MKPLRALIAASLLWPLVAGASDYLSNFNRVKASGDPKMVEAFLVEAGKTQGGNADYYATAGNYWWQLAQEMDISKHPAGAGEYSVRDHETGAEVGSISTVGKVNPEVPARAVEYLSEGARKFPQRVDLVLGLAHVQMEMGKQKACVDTLLRLLSTARKNPDALCWTRNGRLPTPANFLIPEAIQKYTTGLYHEETVGGDELCIKLCEATIAAYPKHPYAYNVRAAVAAAQGDKDGVVRFLEMASSRAPEDALILMNLGEAYAKLGQPARAKQTFEKVLKLPDAGDDMKDQAHSAIEQIDESGGAAPSSQPTTH